MLILSGRERCWRRPQASRCLMLMKMHSKKDIWVYFRDVATAKNVMFALGFVKFNDKTRAWDGQTRRSKKLIQLIKKYCKGTKPLIVESADLRDVIQEKLKVKCSYDPIVADELAWGIKNVLHEFILQEKDNITREHRATVSKGLQQCLEEHLINVSPTMLDADFISEIGLLRCLDINLKRVPKTLRESFDEHACRIGEHIENDLMYTRVLTGILVPELAPKYDFCKMFPPDLALKIQEAYECATQYRDEQRTMHDVEIIMGALSTILSIPEQRDDILIRVKLMEAKLRRTEMIMVNDTYRQSMREPTDLECTTFRRTLLETPSGFAIFDVDEVVFQWPQRIWAQFTDDMDARKVVLALGFVNVHDKSIARDRYHGPGQELSSLIQKLCARKTKLIVQDDALKSVIEDKLEVKCCTKFSNDDDSLGDLMWGLKNVLHEFIPQEENNLTKEYYLPMSKGLQSALESYSINVSHEQMDRKFVNVLGYLVLLDWTSSFLPIFFRKSFDRHVCWIGKLIKDEVLYAKVIERILVPESFFQIDIYELLPNDLAEKVAKVAKNVQASGKFISLHDRLGIMAFHDYLSFVHEKRGCYLQFLKCGGSEEELPRIEEACVNAVNYWLMSVTEASFSDELLVDGLDSLADQMRGEDQADVEVSRTREKALQEAEKTIGKNSSSEDKSLHADHLAISKGAGNIDQQHYLITGVGSTNDVDEMQNEKSGTNQTSCESSGMHILESFDDDAEQKNVKPIVYPIPCNVIECSLGDVEDKKQNEATTEGPSSGESNTVKGTDGAENKEQNADTSKESSDDIEVPQHTDVVEGWMEGTTTGAKGPELKEEEITASGRIHSTLRELFNSENMESTLNRDDGNTHTTNDIFDSEDKGSTMKRNDYTTDTTKEKKIRIQNWLR